MRDGLYFLQPIFLFSDVFITSVCFPLFLRVKLWDSSHSGGLEARHCYLLLCTSIKTVHGELKLTVRLLACVLALPFPIFSQYLPYQLDTIVSVSDSS